MAGIPVMKGGPGSSEESSGKDTQFSVWGWLTSNSSHGPPILCGGKYFLSCPVSPWVQAKYSTAWELGFPCGNVSSPRSSSGGWYQLFMTIDTFPAMAAQGWAHFPTLRMMGLVMGRALANGP